jgi:chorismate--pyruvate lyase
MAKVELRTWLNYPQSITQFLALKSDNVVIEVLAQGFEAYESVFSDASRFWSREVIIRSHGQAVWYARTLVPELTFIKCAYFFSQLNTKSLGDLIFNNPDVERMALIHYPMSKVSQTYQWLPENIKPFADTVLWVRVSSFLLKNQYEFSLYEIYLPDLQRYYE